jgi:putative ABC transport system permease protein
MVAVPNWGETGDRVLLGLHNYTVVGLTRGGLDTNGEPLVYLSLPDAQEVLYQKDNEEVRNQRERSLRTLSGQSYLSPALSEKLLPKLQPDTHIINAILVRLKPGADRAAVARHIDKWLYFSAFTTQEEVQLMLKGRLAGMTKQLLLFRTLLSLISVVIISLVIYTFTMEKSAASRHETHRRPQRGHRTPGDGTIPPVNHQRLFIRLGPDPEHLSALSQDHIASTRR